MKKKTLIFTGMQYKVHRLDVKHITLQEKLEECLNSLHSKAIAAVPNA